MKTIFKMFAFLWLMLVGIFELALGLLSPGHSFIRNVIGQNILFGRMKKGIGNLITYTSYGQNIVRSKPLEVNDANSTNQQAQRGVFSEAQNVCRRLLNAVKIGFANYTSDMSAYAYAIGENMRVAKNSSTPPDGIDISKIVLSKGNLLGLADLSFNEAAGLKIEIGFSDNSGVENALATDSVFAAWLKDDMSKHGSELTGIVKRPGSQLDLTCSGGVAGEKVRVFVWVTSADGSLVSDSVVSSEQTLLA